MQYFINDQGTIFEFDDNVLIFQNEVPVELPKGKTKLVRVTENLIPYSLPIEKTEKKTIEELRQELINEVHRKRKEAENSGIEVNGQIWGSTLKDEIRLTSALKFFEITGVKEIPNWRVSEDIIITLTPDIASNILSNLMNYYDSLFAKEEKKIKEIQKIKTEKSLIAYKNKEK